MRGKDPWKAVGGVFLKLIHRAASRPDRMSDAEWVVYRVWTLLGEVSNGGFDQYFFNSSGNNPDGTRRALKELGAATALAVFEEACGIFPGGPSPDRDVRWVQLNALPKTARKKFEAFDQKLSDAGQDVIQKLAAYIKTHSKSIHPKKERSGRRHE